MNETNVERLKSIKKREDLYIYRSEDREWLIEQAERVPELEGHCKSLTVEWRDGVLENKRLREALEFYAKDENYNVNTTNQWEPLILINQDHGEKARQALEGKRDG